MGGGGEGRRGYCLFSFVSCSIRLIHALSLGSDDK